MAKEVASTDLIIKLPAVMTAETFTNEDEFERLYSQVKEAVDKHVPDLTTRVGREAIASTAYKVSRTKTALIAQGKKLTETWRDQTKKVNAACNTIEERLDTLRDTVRQPLTEWEKVEDARVNGHKTRLESLIAMSKVGFGRPSSELRELLSDVEQINAGPAEWEEFAPQAGVAREDAIDTLKRLLVTAERQEAEAAELEQLRAEKAERDRIEAERLAAERLAQEEADRVERERQAEKKRRAELLAAAEEAAQRVERENAQRIEDAKRAAAEAEERHAKAIRDAEEARQREAEEAKRREQEAEERRARDVAAAQAEAERKVAAERKRVADEQAAEEAAQKARDADKAHRKAINTTIVAELIECSNITVGQAMKIVTQIALGQVSNITLKY